MSRKHWLAAYGEKIPCEINADAHGSVLAMLETAMQRFADRPAFRCFGHTLTYADTDRLSRSFGAFLQNKLGAKKGDRIAVMLPNIAAFPLAFPLLAGPGAITATVLLAGQTAGQPLMLALLIGAIIVTTSVCFIAFLLAQCSNDSLRFAGHVCERQRRTASPSSR